MVVDHGLEELAAADTIVVLPVTRFMFERPADQILQPLVTAALRGCRIVSVCLGAFTLAAAGLLDHPRATTHWRFCAALAAAYPLTQVVPGVLYVDDGHIMTSGGVAAGIDLCLHVVRKDYGAEITNMLARRLVAGPHRDGGQAQFIEQPVPDTSSQRLGPALAWALQHLADNPSPDRLASIAAMSRRTLPGIPRGNGHHTAPLAGGAADHPRPPDGDHRLPVAEIARRSGFEDVSVFRRHFTNQAAFSPNAYRRTFGQFNGESDSPGARPASRAGARWPT